MIKFVRSHARSLESKQAMSAPKLNRQALEPVAKAGRLEPVSGRRRQFERLGRGSAVWRISVLLSLIVTLIVSA
jgi:hypothetical protein